MDLYDVLGITQLMNWGKEKLGIVEGFVVRIDKHKEKILGD